MATIPRSRRLRRREPSRGHRLAWLVLLLTVLLHLVFALMVWWAMRPPSSLRLGAAAPATDVLEVRFIPAATAPAAKAPPPVPLLPPPPSRTPPRHAAAPAAKHALSVQLPAPAPAPAASVAAPRLFDRNGQVILPAAANGAAVPEYVQGMPQGDTRIMQHDNPVKYQATRFDKDWGNGTTNSIDDALQKAVDKTTVKHTFHLPGGIHIHCAVSLAALAGGCGGDPPPPPPPKDGDVRMDMAPARPLAPDPNAPKPPPLSECIALYRAGKPLADGCPSDTPIRAVDDELREQRAKQAKQSAGP
ncbi:hypothetical protein ABQJ54_11800 [Rhodanobacter sp. Si-c]|uniref:Uncharacterized protein n=1 Tax=Rhodanobacter lycopersici TaxID=3162487 RepID=A0ABV3QF22_9GAMM